MFLARLAALVPLAAAGLAAASFGVGVNNAKYDELLDRDATRISVSYFQGNPGVSVGLDCARTRVERTGRRIDMTVAALVAGRAGSEACPFGIAQTDLGTLEPGDYRLVVNHLDEQGIIDDTFEREFHVRPYGGACNRYPRQGSIVNVFHSSLNGTGIANLIAGNPALAAQLGNPQVSLTWYNNAGAQLVYPAPEDPLPLRDRALATGIFAAVGVLRGECWNPAPSDAIGEVHEFHHASQDAYFYTVDPKEIAALDTGTGGWTRTGKHYRAPVQVACEVRDEFYRAYRFWGRPGVGPATHVFTIGQEECHQIHRSGLWQYEASVFYAYRPKSDGTCNHPSQLPVHRVWRPFGESRHRLATEPAVVAEMEARGWIAEGAVMCVLR